MADAGDPQAAYESPPPDEVAPLPWQEARVEGFEGVWLGRGSVGHNTGYECWPFRRPWRASIRIEGGVMTGEAKVEFEAATFKIKGKGAPDGRWSASGSFRSNERLRVTLRGGLASGEGKWVATSGFGYCRGSIELSRVQ